MLLVKEKFCYTLPGSQINKPVQKIIVTGINMSTFTIENKQLIQVFIDEVINKKNLLALRDFIDPSIDGKLENVFTFQGINYVQVLLQMIFDTLPNFKIVIEHLSANGDRVTAQIDISDHLLMEQNLSGNPNLHTFRIEWGKIVQYWGTLPIKIPHQTLEMLENPKDVEGLIQTYGYPTIPLE